MKSFRLGFDVFGYFSFTTFGTSSDFHLVIDPLRYDDWSLHEVYLLLLALCMLVVFSMVLAWISFGSVLSIIV
jgi:hypothetical protein